LFVDPVTDAQEITAGSAIALLPGEHAKRERENLPFSFATRPAETRSLACRLALASDVVDIREQLA
jgi:hypothetical protein